MEKMSRLEVKVNPLIGTKIITVLTILNSVKPQSFGYILKVFYYQINNFYLFSYITKLDAHTDQSRVHADLLAWGFQIFSKHQPSLVVLETY